MIKAAGILLINKDGQALFTQRAPGGDHVGEWCIPGGKIEEGETPLQAACRETSEEVGFNCSPDQCKEHTRRIKDGVDFTTFICKTQHPFTVKVGSEVSAFAWAPLEAPPRPLHPGCEVVCNYNRMHELDIANAMITQDLVSPQRYENLWLFDMRITGTGLAYRTKFDEFAWRDPSIYLNPEFLARCNGLPVILEHPKRNTLNTKEYHERNVGSVFVPYIREREQEVWAIVKIWDGPTAMLARDNRLSTSPAVVWKDTAGNVEAELNSGEKVFVEGRPNLLDHLAICEQGVWDKGGEPRGISTADGVLAMPDEVKKEEKAAADSAANAGMSKLEEMLAALSGTVTDGFKAFSVRMDAVEKTVADAATPKNTIINDADKKAAADKEAADKAAADAKAATDKEAADKEVADKAATDAKAAADKEAADKAAADKAAADKAAVDAFPPKDKDKEKEVADKAAADSITISKSDWEKTLARLDLIQGSMPKALTDQDYDNFAQIQSRADTVYLLHGKSAPRPINGETPMAYRRRLLLGLKEHDPIFKDNDLRVAAVDETLMKVAEESIYKTAADAARNPATVPLGQLREHVEQRGGHTYHRFYGRPVSWMAPFAPVGRRVKRINQPGRGQVGA